MDDEEARQRRAEESQAVVAGLQQPERESPAEKSELISKLTEDDLQTPGQTDDPLLRNLATKDIPSANFSEEEAWEFRHYLDVVLERKRAAYPHENQDVTGVLREWVHDDPEAGLQPVTKQDLLTDETFKQGIAARVTKGKQGTLLGLSLRSIKESVVRRDSSEEKRGGILGKLR
jgi:hypothetical protein